MQKLIRADSWLPLRPWNTLPLQFVFLFNCVLVWSACQDWAEVGRRLGEWEPESTVLNISPFEFLSRFPLQINFFSVEHIEIYVWNRRGKNFHLHLSQNDQVLSCSFGWERCTLYHLGSRILWEKSITSFLRDKYDRDESLFQLALYSRDFSI